VTLEAPPPDHVHVWSARFRPAEPLPIQLLSPAEEAMRRRRVRPGDGDRFAHARIVRRRLLGAYLGATPLALEFAENGDGKPYLLGQLAWDLRFNLSHSEDLVVMAVACGREVGVDVEAERAVDAALVASTLSPNERTALASLPEELQRAGFFAGFARKEAVVKAIGRGLRFPLDAFDVAVDPRMPPRLLASRDRALDAGGWSLCAIAVPPGFHGALAVEGAVPTVRSFDWS
jgi:4'-phosphopantetheinyl transferase